MHCLLIDDDTPTLEALKHIINWTELGVTDVHSVTNIVDAKHMIETSRIDLMICDIEMPRGSGLELLKWVHDTQQQGRFIFLTCHDSFDFASEAIEYNVDAYLLKPLDPLKIKRAVAKSIQQLHDTTEKTKYKQLGEHWMTNIKVVERSFWRDVLMGHLYPDKHLIFVEARKRSVTLPSSALEGHTYIVNLLCLDASSLLVNWEGSLFLAALTNVAEEILMKYGDVSQMTTYKQEDSYYVCYVLPSAFTVWQQQEIGQALIDACLKFLKVEATVYVSQAKLLEELFHARLNLEQLHRENMLYFGTVHISGQESMQEEQSEYHFDNEQFIMLFQAKDKMQIVNKIKAELDTLQAHNKLNLHVLLSFREDLLQVCYSYLATHHIQAHRIFDDTSSKALYGRAERSRYDFMKWAFYVCDKSIELVQQTRKVTGVIENALHYIHTHYRSSLTREEIASHVYLHPDYFAKLFKQKIGKSLTDYINELRINMAKQLLLETDYSISAVALEAGFENISYFSTLFKKYTGTTPNHYRTVLNRH